MRSLLTLHATVFLIVGAILCNTVSASPNERKYKHGISYFHELKYVSGFTHLNYANPNASKGGTLVLSTQTDFNTLTSPTGEFLLPAPGIGWIYDRLLLRSGDEMSGFYGQLADGIWVAEDKRAIAFRLDPRARWHDGVQISAEDVKFTFNLYQSTILGKRSLYFIESIEISSMHEIVFRLNSELTVSNVILFAYMPILPAHYWENRDPAQASLVPPLGSGPYCVAKVKQGRHIVYERVPDYWGRDIAVNRGRYNFDEIRYEVYRDTTVAREAFRKGLIDIWIEEDIRFWATAYDIPARDKGWLVMDRRDLKIEIGVRQAISLNNRLERFSDPRVREALTLAMDFEWQNSVLHYGLHERASSYFPRTAFAAQALPNVKELSLLAPFQDQLSERLFTHVFEYPRSTGVGRNRASLVKARALLAEAGWRIRDGVLVNSRGEPFEIEFLSVSAADQRTLLPYFGALRLLGITGRIRLVEAAQSIHLRRTFEYDATLRNHDILLPPVVELFRRFHSEFADRPQSDNMSGIANPVVDALVERVTEETTLEGMTTACRALDRVLLWGFHKILLNAVAPRRIVYWDRFGRPERENDAGYYATVPDTWWYDEAKSARMEHRK